MRLRPSTKKLCAAETATSQVKKGLKARVIVPGKTLNFGSQEPRVGFAPEIRYVLLPAPALPTEKSIRLVLAYPTVTRERPSVPVVLDVVELLVKRPLPVPEVV